MYKFSHNITKLLFAPNDSSTIESGSMSQTDIENFLKDDDLKLEETPETGEEDTKTGEEKIIPQTEDKIEEELLEPEADDDSLDVPIPRKQVLAKYPNLFKEFPHLDRAVYREQKYSEILPTLKDARVAVDKAQTLDNLSSEFADGNTTTILMAIKQQDPDAFNQLVDNYLQNLRLVDKDAYMHLLSNVVKNIVLTMNKSDDKDMQTAAALVYRFMIGPGKFEMPQNLSNRNPQEDERELALQEREVAFRRTQLDSHVNTVNTRIDNLVVAIIDKNIDPKETMNSYVKAKAMTDCKLYLENEIRKDVRFGGIKDKLWERAADTEYNQESLDKIFHAYMSKAKALLPELIRKVRNEAQKGLGNKSPNERVTSLPVGTPARSRTNTTPVKRSTTSSDKEEARKIPKGMSSKDYLMRD